MAQETLAKARRLPSKTNRNRKAHDGILQWSSLWFTLGLRRWSLWKSRTHTNPGHRQGDAVAERRWVNISTSLWRRRRGKDLALGFYSIFFIFCRQLAAGTNERVRLGGQIFIFAPLPNEGFMKMGRFPLEQQLLVGGYACPLALPLSVSVLAVSNETIIWGRHDTRSLQPRCEIECAVSLNS